MGVLKIAYGDVAKLQTVLASTEDAQYPALNAVHPHLSRKWRTTGCAAEWIKFDAGAGNSIRADSALIVGHNLTPNAVVKIQRDSLDSWTPPEREQQGDASRPIIFMPLPPNPNLCDRGDCESATPPMVSGETVPVTFNATFLPDATQFYAGAQSYRFTKTIAAGTDARVYLTDNALTTDMHGFLAGQTVTKRVRVKIPSGGILGTESYLVIGDYQAGWEWTIKAAQNVYDAWQEVEVTRTLRGACTGMYVFFWAASTAALNEYFNVDEIEIQTDVPVVGDISRFWRFSIEDPGNPAGYIQIGRVFLCARFEGETIDRGFRVSVEDSTAVSRSLTGQIYADLGVKQRVYAMSLGTMRNATKIALLAIAGEVGQHDPVIVIPSEAFIAGGEEGIAPLYACMSKQLGFTEAGGWGWVDDGIEFREAK